MQRPAEPPSPDPAAAWVLAMMFSGVSGDRVRFSTGKKVGFTVAGAVVLMLLCFTGKRRRVRWALGFSFPAFWLLAVMWFWN